MCGTPLGQFCIQNMAVTPDSDAPLQFIIHSIPDVFKNEYAITAHHSTPTYAPELCDYTVLILLIPQMRRCLAWVSAHGGMVSLKTQCTSEGSFSGAEAPRLRTNEADQ